MTVSAGARRLAAMAKYRPAGPAPAMAILTLPPALAAVAWSSPGQRCPGGGRGPRVRQHAKLPRRRAGVAVHVFQPPGAAVRLGERRGHFALAPPLVRLERGV